MTLHITNGDCAADLIRESGVGGEVLPWRDVLHEGPVPAGLGLEELSEVRAKFLSEPGSIDSTAVAEEFRLRDRRLVECNKDEAVVLWFEADLYDQLQLIQLLDHFTGAPARPPVSLICIGEHPAVAGFHGLGQLSARQMADLFPSRHRVTDLEFQLGREAWRAFRAPDPARLSQVLQHDLAPLPFLGDALMRLQQDYPSVTGGLGRTERQILLAMNNGPISFSELFRATQSMEERVFMGDSTVWARIETMTRGVVPAVRLERGGPQPFSHVIAQTRDGARYLEGGIDWVKVNGIDRWIGGVHLTPTSDWRWNGHVLGLSPT